ncbi:MAG: hypothetical protein HXS44_14550 [Theionarchaea archaeon]|nr:hypothetical protein [Theionarchaea archaeon]
MENHIDGNEKQKFRARKRVLPWIIGLVLISMLLLICLRYSPPTSTPARTIRVLFVGNSLTFFNDMPELFAELARSGGYDVEVDMSAQGGWTLSDHASSSLTLDKIDENWDFVILQEQSVIPCILEERNEYMYPAVRNLYEKVHEKGGTVILFMTWGRRDGLPDAGYENFDDMQQQLYTGYMDIADELGVMVAPVGIAWQNSIKKDPHLNLWGVDGIHPSVEGSYLSACVFYATIFGQSPEGLDNSGLSEEMAKFLQAIAAETVLQSV